MEQIQCAVAIEKMIQIKSRKIQTRADSTSAEKCENIASGQLADHSGKQCDQKGQRGADYIHGQNIPDYAHRIRAKLHALNRNNRCLQSGETELYAAYRQIQNRKYRRKPKGEEQHQP